MNSTNEKPAFALVKDADGSIVKRLIHDTCGIPASVWNAIAKNVLDGRDDGRFFPLDSMDVYDDVVNHVLQARRDMPDLTKASPATYLYKAMKFAFLSVVKRVVAERGNQLALLNKEQADEDDEQVSEEYAIAMRDHGYAPLYEAIASLESRQMRIAAWTYLNPSVDGNLYACARAAGVGKSRFYSTFWPMTLRALRRKLES